jgi:hypothetical protein
MYQAHPPGPPQETLPTMYNLPNENWTGTLVGRLRSHNGAMVAVVSRRRLGIHTGRKSGSNCSKSKSRLNLLLARGLHGIPQRVDRTPLRVSKLHFNRNK